MYEQSNICKMVAVLASRFSIHERGAVVEVSNVRIYSEPPPACSVNSKLPVQIKTCLFARCQSPSC